MDDATCDANHDDHAEPHSHRNGSTPDRAGGHEQERDVIAGLGVSGHCGGHPELRRCTRRERRSDRTNTYERRR